MNIFDATCRVTVFLFADANVFPSHFLFSFFFFFFFNNGEHSPISSFRSERNAVPRATGNCACLRRCTVRINLIKKKKKTAKKKRKTKKRTRGKTLSMLNYACADGIFRSEIDFHPCRPLVSLPGEPGSQIAANSNAILRSSTLKFHQSFFAFRPPGGLHIDIHFFFSKRSSSPTLPLRRAEIPTSSNESSPEPD